MKFKKPHMKEQYDASPKKLLEVCEFFNQLSVKEGIIPVVTRVTDPVAGESGVHLQHRAVDFRNEFFDGKSKKWLYPIETVEHIVFEINKKFPRTDGKPVALHHSFKGGSYHFHLQIPIGWVTKEELLRIQKKK
jgi:hypothetical protein